MKKKKFKKTIKYAKNGALLIGSGNAVANVIKQLKKREKDSDETIDLGEVFKAFSKGVLCGSVVGSTVGAVRDVANKYEKPLNLKKELEASNSVNKLDKSNIYYIKLSEKADAITQLLNQKFGLYMGGNIATIGSTETDTALTSNFDIDLVILFKPYKFPTVSDMYYDVFNFIEKSYKDFELYKIRKQSKSIGIIFRIDDENYKIDIVPLWQTGNPLNKNEGYLFKKSNSLFKPDGIIFTDIYLIKLRLSPQQKETLIALKKWKNDKHVPVNSHLLGSLILDAEEWYKGNALKDPIEILLMTIKFIKENIRTIKITSPENDQNILTDISNSSKSKIKKACDDVLCDYKYQPNLILHYFVRNY